MYKEIIIILVKWWSLLLYIYCIFIIIKYLNLSKLRLLQKINKIYSDYSRYLNKFKITKEYRKYKIIDSEFKKNFLNTFIKYNENCNEKFQNCRN